eukprot:snap_masked-scaffold_109-processed-gene-0.3-mRNA-1 protein AED:1.00 eAED:1.00 QI:0/-1/0/0/-1/1/1/0/363
MDVLKKYQKYVRENPEKAKRLEEYSRMILLLAPLSRTGQYSEVITEVGYSFVGNLSTLNEHIIYSPKVELSKSIRTLSMLLTIIGNCEVATEIFIKHFHPEHVKTRFIIFLEVLKVFLRLLLFKWRSSISSNPILLKSNGRYEPKKLYLEQKHKEKAHAKSDEAVVGASSTQKTEEDVVWIGPRTGKVIRLPQNMSNLTNSVEIKEMKEMRGKRAEEKSITALKSEEAYFKNHVFYGEVLYILRPLLYAVAFTVIRKQKNKSMNWVLWCCSLLVDIISLRFSNATGENVFMNILKSGNSGELLRRVSLLSLYLMRSPFYEFGTLRVAASIQNLINLLPYMSDSQIIKETLDYYHNTHFYISNS